ncbi:PIN domain-containing protein [Methanobrevibacter sp. TMH8]|uniref:type II toxin-antitoxin system VapC family toxin n=1 Tax=Methanobrevibacter sp. TMH8 TaxID=2848611 RepID=UPI001CCEBB0F|nr:PIN domain-containing protein [Methanobrevibacter sp. TMH8]MBZ9570593.1 PIN domain-containing protein [Methanobrevibacter sp. TMH8]
MIFLDTAYIVGLFVKNDQWHEKAKEKEFYTRNKEKFISILILSETITLINKKLGSKSAKIVYEYILDNFIIIRPNQEIYDKAIEILVKYNNLSLADSVTIQLMNDLNIYEIISFDSDFDNKENIVKIS